MITDLTKAQGQTWEKLSNISNSDKIGSAYLFNGPIGCGKEGLSLKFAQLIKHCGKTCREEHCNYEL